MHGDVGALLLERHLEFLDEQALAADGGEAAVKNAVALSHHGHEFHLESGMGAAQQPGDMLGLPESQLTLARGDAQRRPVSRGRLGGKQRGFQPVDGRDILIAEALDDQLRILCESRFDHRQLRAVLCRHLAADA